MPYVCPNPESYVSKVEGSGHCVDFVKVAAKAPATSSWKQGAKVHDNKTIKKGTAIATFDKGGRYANKPTGNHAAIYISQTSEGINVYDQWKGHAVSSRCIRFKGGKDTPSNDGDCFSVIE